MANSIQSSVSAELYGIGNAAVTAEQIRAYINVPGRTAAEIQKAAVENDVSVEQISRAMIGNAAFSKQNINSYLATQGITPPAPTPVPAAPATDTAKAATILFGADNADLSDAEIQDYVNRPGMTADQVLAAALANRVSATQLAKAMAGHPEFTLENINRYLAGQGIINLDTTPADPIDFRAETFFGQGNPQISAQQIQDFIKQPGITSRQILDAALEHGVSAAQIADAMQDRPEFSLDNITNYIQSQGIAAQLDPSRYVNLQGSVLYAGGNPAISDDQIRAYINQPDRTEEQILNAALANGVSLAQIVHAMDGDPAYTLDNLNDLVTFKQDTSSLEVLVSEQNALLDAIRTNPSLQGSQEVIDALRTAIAQLQPKLEAARAKVDARFAQGQELDAQATQAENDAAALKAQYDPLQLERLHAQAKIDEQQAKVDAAQADVNHAQTALDAANQAMAVANTHKKKKNRHRAQGEAQRAIDVAQNELAAAQQRLTATQPGLAQAQADAAPAIQAAQALQVQWEAAQQRADSARAKANVLLNAAGRAIAVEAAVKQVLTIDEINLVDVGKTKVSQLQDKVNAGELSGAELSTAVRDVTLDMQAATSLVQSIQATATADRARETEAMQKAVPLQTQAYGNQLITQNLLGDAAVMHEAHAATGAELATAQSDFDAASERLLNAKLAFSKADFAVDWGQAQKDPAKSAKTIKAAQPALDAAQTELDAAQQAFDAAQDKLNSLKHLATPMSEAALDAEFAAGSAARNTATIEAQANAAAGWANLARTRYQSSDALLAAGELGITESTQGLGHLLQTVAQHTADTDAAQSLAAQAASHLAWADQYAALQKDARTSAELTHSEQDKQIDLTVQAGGTQIYTNFLKDKVASATQAYQRAQDKLSVQQQDFQKAVDQASAAAPIANAARDAAKTAEQDAAYAFVQPKYAPATWYSMLRPAIKALLEKKGETRNPDEIDHMGVVDPTQLAFAFGLDPAEVNALAAKMAQEKNDHAQNQMQTDKAGFVQSWMDQELAKRTTTRKQVHLLDDLTQYQNNDPTVQAARQHAQDTATALDQASQNAIDTGETVEASLIVTGLLGQALLGTQTQLQEATATAADLSTQLSAHGLVLANAAQSEITANQHLLHGLTSFVSDSAASAASLNAQAGNTPDAGVAQLLRDQAQSLDNMSGAYAAQIDDSPVATDAARQIVNNAQASSADWLQVADTMKTWAAEEAAHLKQTQALIDKDSEARAALNTKDGTMLSDMVTLNHYSGAALTEYADRDKTAQELHDDRRLYDAAHKRVKKGEVFEVLKTLGLAAAAAVITYFTGGTLGPLVAGLLEGTELGAAVAAIPAVTMETTTMVDGVLTTTSTVVTPGVAAIPAGQFAWAGTAISWTVAGTAADAVNQMFNMAVGVQKGGFDWQRLETAAIAGLVTQGIRLTASQLLKIPGGNAFKANPWTNLGAVPSIPITNWMAYRAIGSAVHQSIMMGLGRQDQFSWTSVLASGLGSGFGYASLTMFNPSWYNTVLPESLVNLSAGFASALLSGQPLDATTLAKVLGKGIGSAMGTVYATPFAPKLTSFLLQPIRGFQAPRTGPAPGAPNYYKSGSSLRLDNLPYPFPLNNPASSWPGAASNATPDPQSQTRPLIVDPSLTLASLNP